jgi:hypothetical protein
MRALIVSAACLALGVTGLNCLAATSHIGNWEYRDGHSFFRLELLHDGSCFLVAGGKEDAIGGQCKYTVSEPVIDIVVFEDNGKIEVVPKSQPLRFSYDASSDSISAVHNSAMVLRRIPWRQKRAD